MTNSSFVIVQILFFLNMEKDSNMNVRYVLINLTQMQVYIIGIKHTTTMSNLSNYGF